MFRVYFNVFCVAEGRIERIVLLLESEIDRDCVITNS